MVRGFLVSLWLYNVGPVRLGKVMDVEWNLTGEGRPQPPPHVAFNYEQPGGTANAEPPLPEPTQRICILGVAPEGGGFVLHSLY